MSNPITQSIKTVLAQFSSTTRLYELTLSNADVVLPPGGLLVEAFFAVDGIQELGVRDVIVLALDAHLDLRALLGSTASLEISLADGSRTKFSGDVSEVAMLGSNGGFTRYKLRLTPWLWRLTQVRNSRVWQDKTVVQIVDSVLDGLRPLAQWCWSADTATFMHELSERSYCCQYRESDHDFLLRLLTEEGLMWRFEETADGQCMVLFADSRSEDGVPEDATSAGANGIAFRGARALESQDTIQALQATRSIVPTMIALLSYDYKAKKAIVGSAPSSSIYPALPALESYDIPGQYAYANASTAQHYAAIQMQVREARSDLWRGRSTARTLAAGTRIRITDVPRSETADAAPAFTVVKVISVGVNNLPTRATDGLAELFGPIPELLEEASHGYAVQQEDFALVIQQALSTGYANSFEAVTADTAWRPMMPHGDGRMHAKPTAHGCQTAIVIGPDGEDVAAGADELYCDKLGRVRVRFHWQDSDAASCWVRVAQRAAGGGMGMQFLPRIGQEVLLQFLENDIDRPIIVGALYNGRGEGGMTSLPGTQESVNEDTDVYALATDHRPSAQGNLAAGNSPVWHGASAGVAGHGNATAQWGLRSKEFGGPGYNQLLFDDTDAQGRVQLRCTHASTELNLGHLIHAADNYRGSFRGQGVELRTDAYGAVRAGAGVFISSYGIDHTAAQRDPAGDSAPLIAMLKQLSLLCSTFSAAATTHQTVALAGHIGSTRAGQSKRDSSVAPIASMLASTSGMVSSDDLNKAMQDRASTSVQPAAGKIPHFGRPTVAIAAKAGFGVSAGASVQISCGDIATLASGADSEFLSGGKLRIHSGQAIGVLGGAIKPGDANFGLQLIAAQGEVNVQAQADQLSIQARDEVNVISANGSVDWAAAKSISLSTAGGANITINGGNITVQCPGKLLVHAGAKHFAGPATTQFMMPVLPNTDNTWVELDARYDDAWNTPWPLEALTFEIAGTPITKSATVNILK